MKMNSDVFQRVSRAHGAMVGLVIALLMVSGICASGAEPDRVLDYKATPQGVLRLHIFTPPDYKATDQRPAIVFFFGGGWINGAPKQFFGQSRYLADRGMVAISAEYRTKTNSGTDPRACVRDGRSAVRWVRAHAEELGIDPGRIAAGGGSAGGHVAAAAAFCDQFDEPGEDLTVSCRPDALVLFNPVIDNSETGFGYDRVKAYWKDFSPMHNLRAGAPPTLFMLGTEDKLIPVETAKEYERRMQKVGARCDVILYEGQPHGFFNGARYKETMQDVDHFMKSLGWIK